MLLNIGDAGDQDSAGRRYALPLINTNSALFSLQQGSFLYVGLDRNTAPQITSVLTSGLYIDRATLASNPGNNLIPIVTDGTSSGFLVDRRVKQLPEIPYTAQELAVVSVPSDIELVSIYTIWEP
jgi:hypothetical protein